MRVTFSCTDVESYLKDPKSYLPVKPGCCNDPSHRPYWNTTWERGYLTDHVHSIDIPISNAYCEKCHETISYWPEFVLPYEREPLETFEWVLVEYLKGTSISEIAAQIGYDPRTVSRWIKLILSQAQTLVDQVIRRILSILKTETILPLTLAGKAPRLLLTWLRRCAEMSGFTHLNRLIGLCNLLGQGDWDLWGAPLGKAKSRVKKAPVPA
jgi:hypothetical protein